MKYRKPITKDFIISRVIINPQTNCWEWNFYRQPRGYGMAKVGGVVRLAHRVAWALWNDALDHIDDEFKVLHKCDNPPCCNPDHLKAGSQSDNMRDMFVKHRNYDFSGQSNGRAKLTEESVRCIIAEYNHGDVTQKQLAAKYDVSQTTISDIILPNNKKWASVKMGISK